MGCAPTAACAYGRSARCLRLYPDAQQLEVRAAPGVLRGHLKNTPPLQVVSRTCCEPLDSTHPDTQGRPKDGARRIKRSSRHVSKRPHTATTARIAATAQRNLRLPVEPSSTAQTMQTTAPPMKKPKRSEHVRMAAAHAVCGMSRRALRRQRAKKMSCFAHSAGTVTPPTWWGPGSTLPDECSTT
jgi:hypothetical protein